MNVPKRPGHEVGPKGPKNLLKNLLPRVYLFSSVLLQSDPPHPPSSLSRAHHTRIEESKSKLLPTSSPGLLLSTFKSSDLNVERRSPGDEVELLQYTPYTARGGATADNSNLLFQFHMFDNKQ